MWRWKLQRNMLNLYSTIANIYRPSLCAYASFWCAMSQWILCIRLCHLIIRRLLMLELAHPVYNLDFYFEKVFCLMVLVVLSSLELGLIILMSNLELGLIILIAISSWLNFFQAEAVAPGLKSDPSNKLIEKDLVCYYSFLSYCTWYICVGSVKFINMLLYRKIK